MNAKSTDIMVRVIAAAAILIPLLVLGGRTANITSVTRVMTGNAVPAFIVIGVGLWYLDRRPIAPLAAGCLLVLLGAGSLLSGSEERLATSFAFLLLGLAFLSLAIGTSRANSLAQWLLLAVAAVGMLVTCGLIMGTTFGEVMRMGPPVPFLLVLVPLAALARSELGFIAILTDHRLGGVMARRLLTAVVCVPVLLGYVRIQAQNAGLIDSEEGTSLFVFSVIVILVAIVSWSASSLNRADGEHRQLMTELAASQRLSRSIIDTASDAFVSMNSEGKIVDWNKRAEEMLGWSKVETIGLPLAEVIVPPELRDGHRHGLARYLETGEGPILNQRIEQIAQHRSGTTIPVELTVWPLRTTSGLQFNAFLQDISARKQAAARVAEFQTRLEQSNRELQEFASIASHDLQEPLRKIQAFGDRLLATCAAKMDAQEREYFERMVSATARMRGLINALLDLSRVTTRAQTFSRVDLATVVHEVFSDLESRIQQTGAEIVVEELPTIDADPTQMRQLLQNLIGNAIKFHRPGHAPRVCVSAEIVLGRKARPQCRLSVADNGIGFDPKYSERIFGVFQRLHGRDEYEGSGIGLAICRKIVERHGGTIRALGRPNEGTTFVVELPVSLFAVRCDQEAARAETAELTPAT